MRMNNLSTWISFVSLVVAVGSAIIAVATFRRSGPQVIAGASVPHEWKSIDDLDVKLKLSNRGLADVNIEKVTLAIQTFGPLIPILEFTSADTYEGPDLPFRLSNGSSQSWTYNFVQPMKRAMLNGDQRFRITFPKPYIRMLIPVGMTRVVLFGPVLVVELGTGREVMSRPSIRLTIAAARVIKAMNTATETRKLKSGSTSSGGQTDHEPR
jgi:hypothetical protein